MHKLKHKKFPKYFLDSFLAAGIDCLNEGEFKYHKRYDVKFALLAFKGIEKVKDYSDPLFIWSSVFLALYHWKFPGTEEYFKAESIFRVSRLFKMYPFNEVIKRSKMYKMDNKRTFRKKISSDDQEFKRRVWWAYYIQRSVINVVGSGFPIISIQDVEVKYPKDDFKYKYGGFVEDIDPELGKLNYMANNLPRDSLPPDRFWFVIKVQMFFGRMQRFVGNRWLKTRDHGLVEKRIAFSTRTLKTIKHIIDKDYSGDVFQRAGEYYKTKEGFDLLNSVEPMLIAYHLKHTYHAMNVICYESELVRSEHDPVSPRRIKVAKLEMLDSAFKSYSLFKWGERIIPNEDIYSSVAIWRFIPISVILNYKYTLNRSGSSECDSIFEDLVHGMKIASDRSFTLKYIYVLTYSIYVMKNESYIDNRGKENILFLMKPYAVTRHDLQPWLIPKYATFFKFGCCLAGNRTPLDVQKYLFLESKIECGSKRKRCDAMNDL
ncbi:hypothetical protein AYI68_g2087 [Smittium mucronatum]|uniref:Transcription factor domain-containing protein n=1 Tax=Smittium mucronatum TaxID=133383 RepID=A0A1R0H3V5_9FUNG|nr:hypothetical protein AYI68_g2087 [Smittium mucronatum]